jgi:hypothetical protein
LNGVLLQTHSISTTGAGAQIIEGNTLSAGMYLYSLYINGEEVDTKRMILTK